MPLTRNNHYVPQLYLKHFASERGIVQRYRILVSRSSVPLWKPVNIAGVGYQTHLYTRVVSGVESDEIERWLNEDFEMPAEKALFKAVNDQQMTASDFNVLIRFLASQIVRTPAFMIRSLPKWQPLAEQLLQQIMDEVPDALKRARSEGSRFQPVVSPLNKYIPLRVTQQASDDGKSIAVKAETVVGRSYWLFVIRHTLTSTLDALLEHKWTILHAPRDLPLFTTDDPVICLNFNNISNFDFGGGWKHPGSEIMLPLSPRHLLYTQIGRKPPMRGSTLPLEQAIIVRGLLARHAHRYIFSREQDDGIEHLRPRIVDADAHRNETLQWQKWHEDQTKAEREVLGNQ